MLIGEVAKATGLNKTTIRYYHSIGLLRATTRTAGTREYFDYDAQAVHIATFVKRAQAAGFTLRELKEIISSWYAGSLSHKRKTELLKKKLAELGEKKAKITRMEHEIAQLLTSGDYSSK